MGEKNIRHGEEFIALMMGLEAEEICALAKFLGVRLLTDNVDPETKKAITRDGADIIDDIIDHFVQLDRTDRRFLIRYLKKQEKKKKHGTATEHTEKE